MSLPCYGKKILVLLVVCSKMGVMAIQHLNHGDNFDTYLSAFQCGVFCYGIDFQRTAQNSNTTGSWGFKQVGEIRNFLSLKNLSQLT